MPPARSVEDLKKNAVTFWPTGLADKAEEASVIPRLIETQDKFISLLYLADKSPVCWKNVLPQTVQLPPNLFLKHLMVLTDLGGEPLKRLKTEIAGVFRSGRIDYVWHEGQYSYDFRSLATRGGWDNKNLNVDGKGIRTPAALTPPMEDVAMLLMFGASAIHAALPDVITDKCILGDMLGKKQELDRFVRQRYIWVSKITGGATANALGHLAQEYVKERLQGLLPDWGFSRKSIPDISQTGGRTEIAFDMVAASPTGQYCAIEVSFQFTTNSTIERKAGQAKTRHAVLARNGHHIAYVIDGAGNFERASALTTICRYSDCTVTFKDEEIETLAKFLLSIRGAKSL